MLALMTEETTDRMTSTLEAEPPIKKTLILTQF